METLVCSHEVCSCVVSAPGDFCSLPCRDQAVMERAKEVEGELACGCGHSDCYRQADSALTSVIEEELET